MNRRALCMGVVAAAVLHIAGAAEAVTIELRASQMVGFAVVCKAAPRLSWAGFTYRPGTYTSSQISADPSRTILARYDLSEIPGDMRITSATWVLPLAEKSKVQSQLQVWRALADWGAGVCYLYRTTRPEPAPWHTEGGRGVGTDRAVRPSAVVVTNSDRDELHVNVTQDVELWHSGIEPNNGWMISVDAGHPPVLLQSPLRTGETDWVLRITYEPQ